MEPLRKCWNRVRERIRNARSIILFADFDGTLAPFTLLPEEAKLGRETRQALARLAARPRVQVRVISGRAGADLERRVATPGVECMGQHGWERSHARLSAETMQRLSEAQRELRARLNGTPNVRLENKGATFALHYRGASSAGEQRAAAAIREMLERYRASLAALQGDCVWEVIPREIRGKGYAARREWRLRAPGALPIYLGNDYTDESAFRALAQGVTARVGSRGWSHAHYFVEDPFEVKEVLKALDKETG